MKKFILIAVVFSIITPVFANITLPTIFTNNMVLQQKSTIKIWGWGKPRENVSIVATWSKDTLKAVADNQAHWEIDINTPEAGGPYEIFIQGYNSLTLSNILIGEVWLCSGQSNMEWSANSGITNAEAAVASANYPSIRFFSVGHRTASHEQIDIDGTGWVECTPETMPHFSAVAYFFAQRLYQETGVPIGLINSSWGGTAAEAWTPNNVYSENQTLAASAAKLSQVPWGPVRPARIYNAMIDPLTKYQIAGTIWYQGEANTANASTYMETFRALINSWRSEWGYDFPFYFAQIAPFTYGANDNGVRVRDAQRRTLKLPNTGMAVVSDIGDTTNIHPQNKLEVGIRLANLALKHHYQLLDITVDSPLFNGFSVEKSKVVVSFKYAVGLHSETKKIDHFELAGSDGVFHPAKASIKDEQVILQSKHVKDPVHVRFAWGNTDTPNIYNQAHLPVSSFSSEYE